MTWCSEGAPPRPRRPTSESSPGSPPSTGVLPIGFASYFGLPIDTMFDFAVTPLTSIFPNNSVAQLVVVDLGGGNASLRLSFPFSAPLRLMDDDVDSTVTIAGTLVLNGTALVPEPASGLLVGYGFALLAVHRRRVGARRAWSSR